MLTVENTTYRAQLEQLAGITNRAQPVTHGHHPGRHHQQNRAAALDIPQNRGGMHYEE